MLSDPQIWVSLVTLTALEVVLSVDNLVVIAILVGRLPREQQAFARKVGMTLALVPRLVLLLAIGWVLSLNEPLFYAFGHAFSGKDLIMIVGGGFLIYKATLEIHVNLEGVTGEATEKVYGSLVAVVTQIALINLVFSINSIITAVGLATEIWVMAVAVILSMIVLMLAAKAVGDFVERHPTIKILTLAFLVPHGTLRKAKSAHITGKTVISRMVAYEKRRVGGHFCRRSRTGPPQKWPAGGRAKGRKILPCRNGGLWFTCAADFFEGCKPKPP